MTVMQWLVAWIVLVVFCMVFAAGVKRGNRGS